MATGSRSGKANFEVTYDVTGAVNQQLQADVKKLQRSLLDLDGAYKTISRGNDIDRYWNTQLSSIDAVIEALQRFDDAKDTWRADHRASDFLKSYNSFIAMGGSKDDVISVFGGEIDSLITKATQLAPVVAEAFDVNRLRSFYSAFGEMKALGADLTDVFKALRAGSPEEMNKALAEMNSQLQEARDEADTLRGHLQTFADAGIGSIEELTTKLKQLENIQGNIKYEFDEFLRRSGLGDLVNTKDVQQYYTKLSEGYYGSVEEAMAAFRKAEKELFVQTGHADVEIDNGQLEAFVTKLTEVVATIREVKAELASLKDTMANTGVDGTGGAVARGVAAELSQSAELSEATRARMAEIAASSVDFKSIIEVLTEMIRTSFEAQGAMGTIGDGITRMLEGLASLGSIDSEKLQAIAVALSAITKMGGEEFGLKGIEKLAPALGSLERLPNTAALQALSGVNLSGFNNLSIKKASLLNLATYLPTIGGVNVDALERLAAINFDNLNNLSVSKASVRNLADLAGIADTVKELQQRIDAAGIPQVAPAGEAVEAEAEADAHEHAAQAVLEHAEAERQLAEAHNAENGADLGGAVEENVRQRAAFIRETSELIKKIDLFAIDNPGSYAKNADTFESIRNGLQSALEDGRGDITAWIAEIEKLGIVSEESLQKIKAIVSESFNKADVDKAIQRQTDIAYKESEKQARAEAEIEGQRQEAFRKNEERLDKELAARQRAFEKEVNAAAEANAKQQALESERAYAEREADAESERLREEGFRKAEALREKELAASQQAFEKEVNAAAEANAKQQALESDQAYKDRQAQMDAEIQKNREIEQYYASRQAAAEKAAAAEEEKWRKELAQMDEVIAMREAGSDPDKIAEINQSEAITKLLTQYEQLKQQHKTVYEANKADIDGYIAKMQNAGSVTEEEYAQMKAAMAGYQREVKTGAEAQEKAAEREANAQKRIDALRNKVSSYINNNTKAYQMFRGQLDSMLSELSSGGKIAPERLAQIANELANIQTAASQAGVAGQTFFQKLQSGWQKFGGWTLVTRSFMKVVQTAKQMVASIKEIDAAMTELRKVTDLTSVGYERFYEQAAVAAKSVGATVSDTINATADFARLGYDVSEALPLAEAALVYKNVGDFVITWSSPAVMLG